MHAHTPSDRPAEGDRRKRWGACYNADYMTISGGFSSFLCRSLRASGLALGLTGCGGGGGEATTTTTAPAHSGAAPETITVLGSRHDTGPFERSLSLKL